MGLHQKLIDIRLAKGNYHTLQKRFYAELTHKFPYIMTKDMLKLKNSIDKEMDIFACACLMYKSTKIELDSDMKANRNGHDTLPMIVSRKPGIRQKYSESKDLHLANRDLFFRRDPFKLYRKDHNDEKNKDMHIMVCDFCNMEKHKSINKDRFEDFMMMLHSIVRYLPHIYGYIPDKDETYSKNGYSPYSTDTIDTDNHEDGFVVNQSFGRKISDNLFIYFLPKSVSFNLLSGYDNTRRDIAIKSITEAITDYGKLKNHSYGDSRPFNDPTHNLLKEIITSYPQIRKDFQKAEKHKREAYKQCESFLADIESVTTPFKVLKELIE